MKTSYLIFFKFATFGQLNVTTLDFPTKGFDFGMKKTLFTERKVFTKVKLKNIGNFLSSKISSSCYNFSTLLFMIIIRPVQRFPLWALSRCRHNSCRYTVSVFDEFWPKKFKLLVHKSVKYDLISSTYSLNAR